MILIYKIEMYIIETETMNQSSIIEAITKRVLLLFCLFLENRAEWKILAYLTDREDSN